MSFETSVHAKAAELIKLAIEMTTEAESGHPTSAASLAHLVTVLMYGWMRFDPAEPDHPAADRLVLSEGHACPIIYAAAIDLGMPVGYDADSRRSLVPADVRTLRQIDSPLDGHPNPAEGFPFFPAATGSLGQGLSIAAGMALAARLDGRPKRIFCLIGDGESREGQIAEALDFLIDYDLKAVCPIFNCNGRGQADRVSPQQSPERLEAKLRAAGFDVRTIDGHDPAAIREALEYHAAAADDPRRNCTAIVARTIKGWGFTSVLGSDVHGKAVEVGERAEALTAVTRTASDLGARLTEGDLIRPAVPPGAAFGGKPSSAPPPNLAEALRSRGEEKALQKGKLAPRKAYGIALQVLGHANSQVVALDGDVRNSTYSDRFHDDPELQSRFFECKIAEQNMVSCAVGLAVEGKIPFVSTFGKFLIRAYDQVEMGLIGRVPFKLVGSHVGASIAADGPSQMALSDVAFFRAAAEVRTRSDDRLMYVLNPADAFCAFALTLAMADHPGVCYLRTMRPDVSFLYDERTEFRLGGHHVLAEGYDLLLAATGYMVHVARHAATLLSDRGVQATLVDLYSLPLEAEAVAALAGRNQGRVLTVEDHYGGSFGSAVADALAGGGDYRLRQMFVRRLPKSGREPEDVLQYVGLSADDIVRTALDMLSDDRTVEAGIS